MKVIYRKLARELSALSLEATCEDLTAVIGNSSAIAADYRGILLKPLVELPAKTEWLRGLFAVCGVLREGNPRFKEAIFMEWCLEGK